MEYKSEVPLPFVLHFASTGLKPLWIVLARLHSRKSWRPLGTILTKHKDTWLKFGSCIKKPSKSSAERRENRTVGCGAGSTLLMLRSRAKARRLEAWPHLCYALMSTDLPIGLSHRRRDGSVV
jgi:hypothetical protein